MIKNPIYFRWLGVAGIELRVKNQILMIDPLITRIPPWKIWFGRVHSDVDMIAKKIQSCDFILVTHAHFDHIMDTAEIIRKTGAMAFGSANSCRLLRLSGVSKEHVRELSGGEILTLKDFKIHVKRSEHSIVPAAFNGSLASTLKPPLRARDYKMDIQFTFMISINGTRFMSDPGLSPEKNVATDVLYINPKRDFDYYRSLIQSVKPQLIVPYHWDDFHRPLSKPTRSWPPVYNLLWFSWPSDRIDFNVFERKINQVLPTTKVLIPEIFYVYETSQLMK